MEDMTCQRLGCSLPNLRPPKRRRTLRIEEQSLMHRLHHLTYLSSSESQPSNLVSPNFSPRSVQSPPTMADHVPKIRLLQASVDPEDESEFRILVDNKFVKYITIDAGLYDCDHMCFEPSLVSLIPPLPPGDWNKGRISRNLQTGDIHFSAVSKIHLPGIKKTWHPTRVDHLELREVQKLLSNVCEVQKLLSNVYEVTCPGFSCTVVAKFARFEWEVPQLEAETTAYEWIEGQQIGPAFLGHLTEEGRVIGFLLARISDCHHATPEDFAVCHAALSRLHKLGIKHGDTNKHNFLIAEYVWKRGNSR